MNRKPNLPLVQYLALCTTLIILCSLTACSPSNQISVFEANQLRRTTGETERNYILIEKLSKESENNQKETASVVQQIRAIQADDKKN